MPWMPCMELEFYLIGNRKLLHYFNQDYVLRIFLNIINNIKNEMGDITIDPAAINKIIRKYYKQCYAHKFNNLEEMNQLLKTIND